MMRSLCLIFAALALSPPAHAQDAEKGTSGLPVPRFLSLGSGEANMRSGPGEDYPILWTYVREGLPMEVIAEWGIWRQLRDPDGQKGWMNQALLSGERTAMVTGKITTLRAEPDDDAPAVLRAEPGVVGHLQMCEAGWCRFQVGDLAGYVRTVDLWGVYPDELVE